MSTKVQPKRYERWWAQLVWAREAPLTLYEILDITPRSVLLRDVYSPFADTTRYWRRMDVLFADKAEKG
jgi:hypothetical protein